MQALFHSNVKIQKQTVVANATLTFIRNKNEEKSKLDIKEIQEFLT